MSIISDIYEEKYGEFIEAADKYSKRLKEENEVIQKKLNSKINTLEFKINTLEKMLLNVCENTYKLKAGIIDVDQLVSIVNGCLSPGTMDTLYTRYISKKEPKTYSESELSEAMQRYLTEYDDVDFEPDDIDKESLKIVNKKKRKASKKHSPKQVTQVTSREEEK